MKKNWIIVIVLAGLVILLTTVAKPIKKAMTRGYQNKNPGNIRLNAETWKGEIPGKDKSFKTFKSMAWGYRAIFVLLRTYINALGKDTIRKIISTYAPTSENDTSAYIFTVCEIANLEPDEKIYFSDEGKLVDIVAGISYQENGIKPNMADIMEGLRLFKTA